MAWVSLKTVEENKDTRKKYTLLFILAGFIFVISIFSSFLYTYKLEYSYEQNKEPCVFNIYSGSNSKNDVFTIKRKDNGDLGVLYGIYSKDSKSELLPFCFDAEKVTIDVRGKNNINYPYMTFYTDGYLLGDEVILHVPKDYKIEDDDEFFKEAILFRKDTSEYVLKKIKFMIVNNKKNKIPWWSR